MWRLSWKFWQRRKATTGGLAYRFYIGNKRSVVSQRARLVLKAITDYGTSQKCRCSQAGDHC